MTEKLPPWLTALVDQRLALMAEHLTGLPFNPGQLIMSPLTEPDENATDAERARWDRTCDRCGKFCTDSDNFYTGHLMRTLRNGQPVYLLFGVCEEHRW